MDLLQSSKKLAITLIGSSNLAAYYEKIAESLTGIDIVCQTRNLSNEENELVLSIITIKS